MSTQTPQEIQAKRAEDYERFKKYTAYTFLIASPVLLALPPRKLDPLAVVNISAFAFSANYLVGQRTGRSIVERIESRISRQQTYADLPSDRALQMQEQMRAARDAQLRDGTAVGAELEKIKARQLQEKGMVNRIWMGGEEKGWMERRLIEEQKAIEEGKGYGDLIQEYIWDVWNWGKKEDEDEDE